MGTNRSDIQLEMVMKPSNMSIQACVHTAHSKTKAKKLHAHSHRDFSFIQRPLVNRSLMSWHFSFPYHQFIHNFPYNFCSPLARVRFLLTSGYPHIFNIPNSVADERHCQQFVHDAKLSPICVYRVCVCVHTFCTHIRAHTHTHMHTR